jgi:hypothetical protein
MGVASSVARARKKMRLCDKVAERSGFLVYRKTL